MQQMVQKSFYIPGEDYADLARLAQIYRQPAASLMRRFIKEGIEKTKKEALKGTDFLLKLANYHFKGGPKDLAANHDKYAWE